MAAQKQESKAELENNLRDLELKLSELLENGDEISRKIEGQIRELNLLSAKSSDMRVAMVTADTAIAEITARQGDSESQIEQRNNEISALQNEFNAF